MKTIRREQLSVLLTTLFLIPVVLIALALAYFVFCEARKAYWDNQVKLMCEKDGGVKIYERVNVTQADYKKWGGIDGAIPVYSKAGSFDMPYFSEEQTKYLKEDNPIVRRTQTLFVRRADSKVIAQQIYYSRIGGDFPSWGHPTSKGCDLPTGGISKQIFNIQAN